MEFENFDLNKINTPVKAHVLRRYLKQADYDVKKTNYLFKGFKQGFSINYKGRKKVQKTASNLVLRVGSKTELWNKVMTEVKEKRFARPFRKIPFENYFQSQIGLVPKDKGKKTRLIFHLSYPRTDKSSVNANIPYSL